MTSGMRSKLSSGTGVQAAATQERPRVPRVRRRGDPIEDERPDEVVDEEQHQREEQIRGDGREVVQRLQARRVRRDASRHPEEPGREQREEREVEEHEHRPEVDLPQAGRRKRCRSTWATSSTGREEGEEHAAHQHEVEMGLYRVAAVSRTSVGTSERKTPRSRQAGN